MGLCAMRRRFDCLALFAKARADYFTFLYSACGGLSLYEAHHMVAASLARTNFKLGGVCGLCRKDGDGEFAAIYTICRLDVLDRWL